MRSSSPFFFRSAVRLAIRADLWQGYGLPMLLLFLVSCKPPATPSLSTSDPANAATVSQRETVAATQSERTQLVPEKNSSKNRSQPVAGALEPGQYCYQSSDEIEDIQTRITVDSADRVTGDVQGVVHHEAASYYTSYRQKLDGTIDGSNLNLDVAIWIEGDQQNVQETWQVSPTELSMGQNTLAKASCEVINQAFQGENGQDVEDSTQSAGNVKTQQVYFDAGTQSTTVSNAVVRGDRDRYILTAQGGQQMTLSITSVENNAVFTVIDPNGLSLGTEMTAETIGLPNTGDYEIIVGGTRGNATYDLAITIE